MASRFVWQIAGLIFVIGGLFGKFGAALAIIPDPVVGGILMMGFAMILSVALSNLANLDIRSIRNQVILGVAMTLGIASPIYMSANPGIIKTGMYNSKM